jgi:hypothetical protein
MVFLGSALLKEKWIDCRTCSVDELHFGKGIGPERPAAGSAAARRTLSDVTPT